MQITHFITEMDHLQLFTMKRYLEGVHIVDKRLQV